MRSKYIVIEGLEGAGKTTARNVVVETLEQLGIRDMVFTREPGGTQLAEKLRSLVLDIKSVGDEVITDKAEVLMFYAARVQLVETVIKPALANGTWVIGDRHDLSTRTRARYLELAAQDKSIHTIDATQPLEAVMDAIRTTVTNWVKELDA